MAHPLVFGFLVIAILLAMIALIFFPEAFRPRPEVNVTELCISKCREELAAGRNLTAGPCLLNPIPQAPDWVCDVAHLPREDIDNLPENQCSAFREGKAANFVEVSPECQPIKSYRKHIFLVIWETTVYYLGRMANAAKELLNKTLVYLHFK